MDDAFAALPAAARRESFDFCIVHAAPYISLLPLSALLLAASFSRSLIPLELGSSRDNDVCVPLRHWDLQSDVSFASRA